MQRISRRKLLKMAAALGVGAAAETIKVPKASGGTNTTGVQIGAIRWDPWYGSIFENDMGRDLGLSQFQYRAPWFGRPLGNYFVDINGNTQSVIDLECQIAAAAGINYWMFDWNANSLTDFTPTHASGMLNAWILYNTSAYKNLVKWCFMEGISGLGFNRFTNYVNQMIIYMGQSNYFTVISGRPVMYIFVDVQPTTANGYPSGWGTVAAGITALRNAASVAGIGNPYVVIQEFAAAAAAADCASAGADAISSYTNFTWGYLCRAGQFDRGALDAVWSDRNAFYSVRGDGWRYQPARLAAAEFLESAQSAAARYCRGCNAWHDSPAGAACRQCGCLCRQQSLAVSGQRD